MPEDKDAPNRQLGKWGQRGVPRKGWEWVGFEDLGDERQICEMCEFAEIRYVHFAQHDEYPETLGVGCVCVEHMTEDYVRPRRYEKEMQNQSRRRAAFPKRKKWELSRKGNPHIDLDGYRVVLLEQGGGWKISIKPPHSDNWVAGRKFFPTEHAAKLAAFDGVMWLQSKEVE